MLKGKTEMGSDIISLIFVGVILFSVLFIFVKISLRLRKHGGSLTTTMHAATYELLSKDLRDSVKEVVEMKTNKKMNEEASDKPIDNF